MRHKTKHRTGRRHKSKSVPPEEQNPASDDKTLFRQKISRLSKKRPFSKRVLGLFTVIFAVLGAYLIFRSFAAEPALANLWVDNDGGSCSYSSTPAAYNSATACSDPSGDSALEKAYGHASLKCGETIRVKAGSYAYQNIDFQANRSNCSSRVNILGEPGAVLGGLRGWGLRHAEISGLKMTGTALNLRPSGSQSRWVQGYLPSEDVVFSNLDITTLLFRNVVNVTVKNSSIGGFDQSTTCGPGGCGVPKVGAYQADGGQGGVEQPSTNVVFENNFFHDIIRTQAGTAHAECFYIDAGVDGLVLRNNTFTNCGVYDIFSEILDYRSIDNVLIENNFLDISRDQLGNPAAGPSAISFKGSRLNNITVRYNNILGAIRSSTGVFTNLKIEYNNFWHCVESTGYEFPDSAFNKNITKNSTCGPTDILADPLFVSSNTSTCPGWPTSPCYRNDLHLQAGSPAIDAAASAPPTDFDGQARPQGSAPDIGADEYGSGSPIPPSPPPPTTPVYRFYHPVAGHFYTASESEKASLISQSSKGWIYEGARFKAYAFCSNKSPVYRFVAPANRWLHFYTASLNERNILQKPGSGWAYEGVGFCADSAPTATNQPIWRYLLTSYGAQHFYTAGSYEKSLLDKPTSGWTYEKIGWWGPE